MSNAAARVQRALESGNTYEAHEMMKTTFYRIRNKGDKEGSYELCKEGALAQLARGELKCGQEMAKMMAEAYTSDALPADDAAVDRVLVVLAAFDGSPLQSVEAAALVKGESLPSPASEFMQTATNFVKWARKNGPPEMASKILGAQAAWLIESLGWKASALVSAVLVQARHGSTLGSYLAECAGHGAESERDLFAARGLLQLILTAKSKEDGKDLAREGKALLDAFKSAMASRGAADALGTPLGRFCDLFVEAIERQKPDLGKMLLQAYHNSLIRDPNLKRMAQQAVSCALDGQNRSGPGGLFGELMKMLG